MTVILPITATTPKMDTICFRNKKVVGNCDMISFGGNKIDEKNSCLKEKGKMLD